MKNFFAPAGRVLLTVVVVVVAMASAGSSGAIRAVRQRSIEGRYLT